MKKLRDFHSLKLKAEHSFDIFERIEFYENLWEKRSSCYDDYEKTKTNIISLKRYIDVSDKEWVLCHIDSVADNFLITDDDIKMIDWEYAGMQDPHLDIAMFALYSYYDKKQTDKLIDCYFDGNCNKEIRKKIYAYISICGLLWSNWCEYKKQLGIDFGEYAFKQYQLSKQYYDIFMIQEG
jgi:thiamine kinase-like enzyme